MPSFWRSLHGYRNCLGSSRTLHLGSSKVLPNGSTCGRETSTNILHQSTVCSNHYEYELPPRRLPWNFLIAERQLPTYRDLRLPNSRISHSGFVGNNTPFRCMTTVVHPETSSGQSSAAVHSEPPQRIKFKRLDKTAKHIMNILDREEVEKVRTDRVIPDIRPGYIIQLKVEVPENKRRVSVLKGIVIAKRNAGLNSTFRLRRMVAGVGVESVFPLYSPNIKEITILDKKKVRRAKLYYLRDRMNALKK